MANDKKTFANIKLLLNPLLVQISPKDNMNITMVNADTFLPARQGVAVLEQEADYYRYLIGINC